MGDTDSRRLINTLVLLVVFPGALPTGPLYNLAATLATLFGIYLAHRFAGTHSNRWGEKALTVLFTAFGTLSRVGAMTLINWAFLRYPPPLGFSSLGFSLPEEAIMVTLPLIVLFNATLALYTIPLGYIVAKRVSLSLKMRMPYKPIDFFNICGLTAPAVKVLPVLTLLMTMDAGAKRSGSTL